MNTTVKRFSSVAVEPEDRAPPAGIAFGIPQEKVLIQFSGPQELQKYAVNGYRLLVISYQLSGIGYLFVFRDREPWFVSV